MPLYKNTHVDAPQFSQDVVGEALKQSLSSSGLGDESLSSVMESAKEGLLNLCTNVGLIPYSSLGQFLFKLSQ